MMEASEEYYEDLKREQDSKVKVCSSCKKRKPFDKFEKDKRRKHGIGSRCLSCITQKSIEWQKNNRDRKNATARKNYNPDKKHQEWLARMNDPERRAKILREMEERRKRNPLKTKARQKAQRAARSGQIQRPEKCEECGKSPKGRSQIEAHHDDYNKPLDVRWLCSRCHRMEHTAYRNREEQT